MLLFLGILFSVNLHAQNTESTRVLRFSGIVLDKETSTPIPNVHSRKGTAYVTTDTQGRFALTTEVGDTVSFSHIGYKDYTMIVPDTLLQDEYMLAIFMSVDTLLLPEVIVIPRYRDKHRMYRMNAQNNMAGLQRDAFSPSHTMTPEQNQKRVLNQFAASTNKGHVEVGLGVGNESWRTVSTMRRNKALRNEPPPLLNLEEIDLIKMVFSQQE